MSPNTSEMSTRPISIAEIAVYDHSGNLINNDAKITLTKNNSSEIVSAGKTLFADGDLGTIGVTEVAPSGNHSFYMDLGANKEIGKIDVYDYGPANLGGLKLRIMDSARAVVFDTTITKKDKTNDKLTFI